MVSLAESSTTHDACADLPNAVNVPNEFGFRFAETGTCLTTIVTDESVTALAVALILTLMPAALLALSACARPSASMPSLALFVDHTIVCPAIAAPPESRGWAANRCVSPTKLRAAGLAGVTGGRARNPRTTSGHLSPVPPPPP